MRFVINLFCFFFIFLNFKIKIESNQQLAHQLEWGFHTARVNCLAWAPDSIHLASGSLDTGIIIWDATQPTKHFTLKSIINEKQSTVKPVYNSQVGAAKSVR